MKITHMDYAFFGRHVVAVIGCNEYTAIDAMQKYVEKELGSIPPCLSPWYGAEGWCQTNNGDIYIWGGVHNQASILLHELVHAAFQLCKTTDIHPEEELICRIVEQLKLGIMDKLMDSDQQEETEIVRARAFVEGQTQGYESGINVAVAACKKYNLLTLAEEIRGEGVAFPSLMVAAP